MTANKKSRKWARLLITLFTLGVLIVIVGMSLVHIRYPVRHMETISANRGVFDEEFILAVIHAESSFRPRAVSRAYAIGLMQIIEPTGYWLATLMDKPDFETEHLFDPETNIAMGAFFLNWLYNYYDGDKTLVLAGYNAGLGKVNRWLTNPEFSHDGETLHFIPYPETREYVRRVERNMRIYGILLRLPWIDLAKENTA